jgi:GDP-D-mannose dehydratase
MYLMLRRGRVISWQSLLRLRFGWWGWIGESMWASDKGLCRPTDIAVSRGNPSKAMERLGWVAKHQIADIVRLMIEARKDR